MVAPLVPYGIRGVIWYQGETNATGDLAGLYADRFKALIRDWRFHWHDSDLPFLFVQLPPALPTPTGTVEEAQRQALSLPQTAMVSTVDCGDGSLHPPINFRLANGWHWRAKRIAYRQHIEYSGPLYAGMTVEGNAIRLRFTHVGNGLATPDGTALKGFTIAGADGKFVPATASIEHETILVSNENISHPVTVRYAWTFSPGGNLINKNGLPAPTFMATVK